MVGGGGELAEGSIIILINYVTDDDVRSPLILTWIGFGSFKMLFWLRYLLFFQSFTRDPQQCFHLALTTFGNTANAARRYDVDVSLPPAHLLAFGASFLIVAHRWV